MDSTLTRTFRSCYTDNEVPKEMWGPKQPHSVKGIEACAGVKITKADLGLWDLSCLPEHKRTVICELEKSLFKSMVAKPVVNYTKPTTTEEPIDESELQADPLSGTYFVLPDQISSSQTYIGTAMSYIAISGLYRCQISYCRQPVNVTAVSNLESLGILVPDCGSKKYLFTHTKINYVDLWRECCALGMIPASLEKKDDLKCLHQKYITKAGKNANWLFYTGQMDAYLDRRLVSCASGALVPGDMWWAGEPNNDMKREACVALKLDNKTAGLVDYKCGEYTNALCESTDNLTRFSSARNLTTTPWPSTKPPANTVKPPVLSTPTNKPAPTTTARNMGTVRMTTRCVYCFTTTTPRFMLFTTRKQ